MSYSTLLLCLACALHAVLAQYESYDGVANNAANLGAVNQPFCRVQMAAAYTDAYSTPAGATRPNPRLLSQLMSSMMTSASTAPTTSKTNSEGLSELAAAWAMLVYDDLIYINSSTSVSDYMPISVPCCDTVFDISCSCSAVINYTRASWTNTSNRINGRSSFLDASIIYGHSATRAMQLRTFENGHLKTDAATSLPLNVDGVAMNPSVDPRLQRLTGNTESNYLPVSLALHGLFIAHHNDWTDKLRVLNPSWDDELLYQEARKRVKGTFQSLTYQQFLPPLAGPQKAITVFYNASNTPDPCVDAFFAVVALPAVILSASTGTYPRFNADLSVPANGPVSIDLHAYRPSSYLLDGGLDPVLLGALLTPMQSIDVLVTDLFRRASNGPGQPYDALAAAIQRARDFGIPSYVNARRALSLTVPANFDALDANSQVREALRTAYNNDITLMDALVGGLAELHTAPYAMGPLFRASWANQFQRTRDGDRLWFERVFVSDATTLAQLQTISMSDFFTQRTSFAPVFGANLFYHTSIGTYATRKAAWDVAHPTVAPATSTAPTSIVSGNSTIDVPTITYLWLTPKFGASWRRVTVPTSAITPDWMQISLTVNTIGWFSLGIGRSMASADFMIANIVNGVPDAHDYGPALHFKPPLDTVTSSLNGDHVVVISGYESNGWSYLTYRRPIIAVDAVVDNPLKMDGLTDIIFAYSPTNSDTVGFHGNNRFSGMQVDFRLAPSDASVLVTSRSAAYIVHAIGMAFIFGIILPLLTLVARFAKETSFWLKFHRNAAYLATTTTIPLAATAFGLTNSAPTTSHHSLGFAMCGVIIVTLVSGYIAQWWMQHSVGLGTQPKFALALALIKGFHIYIGYIICAVGFYQMKLGMDVFPLNPSEVIPEVYFWGTLGFWIGLALMLELFKKRKLHLYVRALYTNRISSCADVAAFDEDEGDHTLDTISDQMRDSDSRELLSNFDANWKRLIKSMGNSYEYLPLLSIQEFIERVQNGNRWVRLRDLILDLAPLNKTHPGGRAVLDAVIRSCKDIEPFICGTDVVPTFPSLTNTHSSMAWTLMQKLPVGRLDMVGQNLTMLSPTSVPNLAVQGLPTAGSPNLSTPATLNLDEVLKKSPTSSWMPRQLPPLDLNHRPQVELTASARPLIKVNSRNASEVSDITALSSRAALKHSTSLKSSTPVKPDDQHQKWALISKHRITPTVSLLMFTEANSSSSHPNNVADNTVSGAPATVFGHFIVTAEAAQIGSRRFSHISLDPACFMSSTAPSSPLMWSRQRYLVVRQYPEPARMSRYLHQQLQIGQSIDIELVTRSGYAVNQSAEATLSLPKQGHIVCIGGGTGVLPFLDLALLITHEHDQLQTTKLPAILSSQRRVLSLIVCARSVDELLAAHWLSQLAQSHSHCLHVHVVLPERVRRDTRTIKSSSTLLLDSLNIPVSFGHLTPVQLKEIFDVPFESSASKSTWSSFTPRSSRSTTESLSAVFVCGPPDFESALMERLTTEMGLSEALVHTVPA